MEKQREEAAPGGEEVGERRAVVVHRDGVVQSPPVEAEAAAQRHGDESAVIE
ncbi:hypothetical protein GCM10023195_03260 [Actinoallomurus liliacearum]|uniref:Uncharacterized protein n=1 Tax=Actinoallomurus liliacearum TaxID=1080073 RepID=A0ABP8TD60_9ACTN